MNQAMQVFKFKVFFLPSLPLLALLTFLPSITSAQSIVRGPYLQTPTPTSIIVKWRTDIATDSAVAYAESDATLITATDPSATTEHAVTLTGLAPDTLYNYTIGTTTIALAGGDLLSNGDGEHFFTTAPVSGTDKPTRVWVIGDSGTADANALAVKNAYKTFTGARGTDVWLMLGDNAYSSGTDSQFQSAVFNIYPQLLRQVPLWSALGNHDAVDMFFNAPGAYPQIFSFPTAGEAGGVASTTENYYSFDYGDIHFIALDSTVAANNIAGSPMYTWLANDLAANTQRWTIAFWHHPHYSKGSHDSDSESFLIRMRENAIPILEAGGVDLVLTGHSHSYERSMLIDSHHGLSTSLTTAMVLDNGDGNESSDGTYIKAGPAGTPNEGAVHAVVGSSGKIEAEGSLDHPVMNISALSLGSLVLDISGNKLEGAFINSTGVLLDEFAIIKEPAQVVDIDVDPWNGAAANELLPASDNLIPVAILGMTTASGDASNFDPSQIDPSSIKLGIGEAANIALPWIIDIDTDGHTDSLFAFRTMDAGVFCGDTEISLTGETFTGEAFIGTDNISTTDCADEGCHP